MYLFVKFIVIFFLFFFFSSRRRHTRLVSDWSSDVCSSDLGSVLGNYVIEAQLGTGAFGTVFRARDQTLARTVAIKIIHPGAADVQGAVLRERSEERRVGKECRCRWWPYH